MLKQGGEAHLWLPSPFHTVASFRRSSCGVQFVIRNSFRWLDVVHRCLLLSFVPRRNLVDSGSIVEEVRPRSAKPNPPLEMRCVLNVSEGGTRVLSCINYLSRCVQSGAGAM
ncbi:hypothetical protein AVEN_4595-1 [Araneus ventricosus]|uniref:Uncharacterized protein n=1 Tax=Araneus ventricosus TaxID=182803 RepID=A0A4Y2PHA8_ARAVE|nr:hypothetical protein AVEN_4595-1 [Araneus ventricosus]